MIGNPKERFRLLTAETLTVSTEFEPFTGVPVGPLFNAWHERSYPEHYKAGTFDSEQWTRFRYFYEVTPLGEAAIEHGLETESYREVLSALHQRGLILPPFDSAIPGMVTKLTVDTAKNIVAPWESLHRDTTPFHRGITKVLGLTPTIVYADHFGERLIADRRCSLTDTPLRVCFPDDGVERDRSNVTFYPLSNPRTPYVEVSVGFFRRYRSWFRKHDKKIGHRTTSED